MEHKFNVELAEKYGILESVLIGNLFFWIQKNVANDKNYFDDRYWTYNSIKAFAELIPYASARQINYALNKLKDKGIIQTGNFNKSKYDRTIWYTFTDFGISELHNVGMDFTKLSNGKTEDVKPIPYKNTDKKQNIKERKKEEQCNDLPCTENMDTVKRKKTTYDSIIDDYTNNSEVKEAILEFIKMRKLIKSPMTDRALKTLLSKLDNLSSNDKEKIDILNQSIVNSWKSVYALKKDNNWQPKKNGYKPQKFEQEEVTVDEISELRKQLDKEMREQYGEQYLEYKERFNL